MRSVRKREIERKEFKKIGKKGKKKCDRERRNIYIYKLSERKTT